MKVHFHFSLKYTLPTFCQIQLAIAVQSFSQKVLLCPNNLGSILTLLNEEYGIEAHFQNFRYSNPLEDSIYSIAQKHFLRRLLILISPIKLC
jgi:hypothetical protein